MICPKCKAEYREGFDTCTDCGVPLLEFTAREYKYSTWERWTRVGSRVGSWVGAITLLFVGYAIAKQFVASYYRTLFAFGCGFAGRYLGHYIGHLLVTAILPAPTEDDRLREKDPWRTKEKE